MTAAAVYLRISQDPTGEQAGVTRQREDCLALVEQQGWAVFEVYEDNDISASSGKVRPAYERMLAAIRAGGVDAVVAWHPDRLYRKLRDLEELIEAVEKRNVVMRTVRAGEIDLSTPTGRMLARILSATAQAEGEVKADRWRRSWRQGREAGRPAKTGSRLFGYTHEGDLVPREAAIARRMASDILTGLPILTVSRRLEAEGVLTTRGGVWRPGTVRQYLANPRIAGYSTLAGEIVADGDWTPILDRDTWETVRALLTARGRAPVPRASVLNGLIHCGACGHRLITSGRPNRKGGPGIRTYRCPDRPGMPGCGKVSADAHPVETVVEAYARARLADPRVTSRVAELHATAGAGELLVEIASLEGRLTDLDAQLDEPGVPVQRLLTAIDRTKERLARCQSDLADATRAAMPHVHSGGAEWPEDLARRRDLIAVALGEDTVWLDPAPEGANRFVPDRVRVARTRDAPPDGLHEAAADA